MNSLDARVFGTNVTSHNVASQKEGPQNVVFVASITVGGREVFTRYYTNNHMAQMTFANNKVTTRLAVYDYVEAEAFLLQDFATFLAEKWMQ